MSKKDIRQLRRQYTRKGWKIVRTNKSHYLWISPEGKFVTVSGATPSDPRSIQNLKSRLRKVG